MEFKKKFTQLTESSKPWPILEQNSWWTDCCMTVTLGGLCVPRSLRWVRIFYFDKVWLLLCMSKIMSLQTMMCHSTPCKEKLHILMPVPGIGRPAFYKNLWWNEWMNNCIYRISLLTPSRTMFCIDFELDSNQSDYFKKTTLHLSVF